MRHLALSLSACLLVLSPLQAQSPGSSGMQVPIGQTLRNVEFPFYQDGALRYRLTVTEATGITQNRAEATNVKIQLYDKGVATTTITSPKADLLVNEQKMRSKNTVLIVRAEQEASAQTCDFDLRNKKYLLRTNVKVILKNFEPAIGKPGPIGGVPTPEPAVDATPLPTHPPGASILDTPGSYSDTNTPPLPSAEPK